MLTFLFWNIRRNNLAENIARLVERHSVDVVILAESDRALRPKILTALTSFHYLPDGPDCDRLQIYTRFPSNLLQPLTEGDRFRAHALPLNGDRELILFTCHFISLTNRSSSHPLDAAARRHAQVFRDIEADQNHDHSIVFGDLNLNPWSEGIAFEDGFCARMTKTLALQRTSSRNVYPFYNPMWSGLGDASPGPPGSYYYSKDGPESRYFWHTFDQVLLRPSVLDAWQDDFLIRPVDDGVVNFLTRNGIPDKKISDHLPLIFSLNLDINNEQKH
jgi:Endonuclease/Exonuclease/phosphatase family